MNILVLEASTTSAKVMLYNTNDNTMKIETKKFPGEFFLDKNQGEQDIDKTFDFVCDLSKNVTKSCKVDAIALSTTWHSLVMCNKQMKPVAPAYLWSYSGANEFCLKLRENQQYCLDYYNKTGSMVSGSYAYFKMLNLKANGYDLSDKYIFSIGSYFFYRLTGKRITTESMASGSGYMNIHTKKYDSDLLDSLNICESQLEELTGHKQTWQLDRDGSNMLNLPLGTMILPCYPDGALNQVASALDDTQTMSISVGTSAALRINVNKPVLASKPGIWCYMTPYGWLSGAATSGACNCVDWVKDKFFSSDVTYNSIESNYVQKNEPPIFMPFIFGERSVGWDPKRVSGFLELKSHHTSHDMYMSVLEGVLFNIKQCYDMLCNENGDPHIIDLSGGILNSVFWTQMCADVLGAPVFCSDIKQTSVMGAAFLAMEILGFDIHKIKENMNKGKHIYPNMNKKSYYESRYKRYLEYYVI